ncbi:MAG: hypothetical protein HZB19_11510 [Chloroflexi bacterium]|nr:hypothetical protein [Chloroflexota bacterium]
MIAPITYQPSFRQVERIPPLNNSSGLSRMFAAAVVNQQFCEMLLRNPHEALQKGYLGETFSLSKEERDLIVSIRARSLSDLARQVNRSLRNQY